MSTGKERKVSADGQFAATMAFHRRIEDAQRAVTIAQRKDGAQEKQVQTGKQEAESDVQKWLRWRSRSWRTIAVGLLKPLIIGSE